jgi:hypothetical protein
LKSAEPRAFNSYDAWKCFALVAMTIDHVGYYWITDEELWRMVGRLAMPVFAFLLGYNSSYRGRPELSMVAACVSIAELARGKVYGQNILWTLAIVRWAMRVTTTDFWKRRMVVVIPLSILFYPVTDLFVEYGTLALLWAIVGRLVREGEGSAARYYYLASAYILSVLIAWDIFVRTTSYGIAMALALGLLSFYLLRFTVRPVALPRILATPLIFLSQNALYYYAIHVVVIGAVGYALGIEP